MNLYSMTGYASQSIESPAGKFTLEIKSVNSRFLDLQFRINDEFRTLELPLREAINKRVTRGKVECRLSFGKNSSELTINQINQAILNQLMTYQQEILKQFPSAATFSTNEILKWPGVIVESEINNDIVQPVLNSLIESTLEAFLLSRSREGDALKQVMLTKISEMEAIVEKITPLLPEVLSQYQQRAIAKMQTALGIALEGETTSKTPLAASREEILDRIRQEVTLYGIRIDVAEELARLQAHLGETRAILNKGGNVGKRLDFMMQELNREANTLGSKAAIKELADASMELKLLIEQIREQVQNLE